MVFQFKEADSFLKLDLEEEYSSFGAHYGTISGKFDYFGFSKEVSIGHHELLRFLKKFKEIYENLQGEACLYEDDFLRYFSLKFNILRNGVIEVKISFSSDDELHMFKSQISTEQSFLNEMYLNIKNAYEKLK